MKKQFKIAMPMILASSLLLAGCGQTAPAEDQTSPVGEEETSTLVEGGTVALTIWGPEEDAELLSKITSDFQSAHPNTTFEFTIDAHSESDVKEELLGDVNNAPDVFTFADDQLSALVASGVLKPIEEADSIKAENLEGSVNAASINDNLYAYPLTADNGYFLFYNSAYLTEEDVASMDSLLAVASAAGKRVTMDWSSGWYLYSFFGNTGLTLGLNDDGLTNYCDWNSTENAIKGVDIAQGMLAISNSSAFENGGDTALTEGAQNDTVIAGVSGVWSVTALEEAWGENLAATKLPTYTVGDTQVQMSSFAGYKMVGVNSYSENRAWANEFAKFLTNEDNQSLRFSMRSQGPSNVNAAASPAVEASVGIQALLAQSDYATLQRVGGAFWDPTTTFGEKMAAGNPSGEDLQTMLDDMVADITAAN